jgi:hypothetical protein
MGSYTAFEVEAERRREVLEGSMRDARRLWDADAAQRETSRPDTESDDRLHGEAGASLLRRSSQGA